jgi:hypothetical protein
MRHWFLLLVTALLALAIPSAQGQGVVIGSGGQVAIGAGNGTGTLATGTGYAYGNGTNLTYSTTIPYSILTGAPSVGGCTSGQYMTALNSGTSSTCAQISYSQISGTPTIPTSSSWPNAGTCPTGQLMTAITAGVAPTCSVTTALDFTPVTVSTLPTISGTLNGSVWVKDGISASDCSVGGGSYRVSCVWDGLAWDAVMTATSTTQSKQTSTVVATMTSSSNANSSVGTAPVRKALGNCYNGYNSGTSSLLPTTNGGNLYCTAAIQTSATAAGGPTLGYVSTTLTGIGTSAFANGNGAGGVYSPTAVTSTFGGTADDSACTTASASVTTGVTGLTLPGCVVSSSAFYSQTTGTGANVDSLFPTAWTVANGDQADHLVRETWWRVNNLATLQNLEYDTNYHPSTSDYYGWGWQYNNQSGKQMFQYCPQGCSSWSTVKLVDPTGVHATVTSYPITQGHWYHTRIYMDRGPTATCTSASTTGCFYYRQLYLEDVTAGTGGVLYNILDATTGQTPSGIPVSYPTWTKNQFTLQHQLDMNTASATTTVDVDSDSLTAYYLVSGTAGPTTAVETKGSLGEWDFDGSDTGSTPSATGTPTTTTNAYSAPSAMEYNAAAEYNTVSITSSTTIYARFYVQINTSPAASVQVFGLYNGTTQVGNLYFNSSNQYLTFYNTATASSTNCATGALSTNTFHLVELYWTASATTGAYTVKIDGTQTCNVTGANTGTAQVSAIRFGELNTPTSLWDLTIDNVGVDAAQWLGAVTFASTSLPTYQPYMAGVTSDNNNGQIVQGTVTATGGVDPGLSTVGGLGAASASTGKMRRVTDSTGISSEGQTCTGGGSTVALAFSNGSVWKCF